MLASPRFLFAFARDSLLPARLAAVHPRHRTLHVAICVHAALVSGVALSGTYERLAVLSAEAALAIYLACCLAAMVLKRRDVRSEGEPFRVPGGPAVPLLACLTVLWILSGATRAELAGLVGMLANAGVIFAASWTVRRARACLAAS